MPKRIGVSNLNATTLDILNTIRANAPYEYQSQVPQITRSVDVPKVGEIICGTQALSNQFLNALINRIALVVVKSATFNNPYANLKKGYLEFGETVEEVFVNLAKAREFSAEKAESREFKRTLPDVRTAFHTLNWRVQYPITIQQEDLRMAFTSASGVKDLVAKILASITTSSEYDEFLLFKYLIIKGVSSGKMYPVSIGDGTDLKEAAVEYRGMSNKLTFISTKYNAEGVHTNTAKADQYIFMDAHYNAEYDVNVLASAFNMEKADFMGRLHLIDDFTTFDNERFSVILDDTSMIEEVTDEELELMQGVKAVLVDKEWFQVYDNLTRFSEVFVSNGLYWNYNYHIWKTISYSPFSNAIAFVTGELETPDTFDAKVGDVSKNEDIATVFSVILDDVVGVESTSAIFEQTEQATKDGIAIQRYGAVMKPVTSQATTVTLTINVKGTKYNSTAITIDTVKSGDKITFTKE